MTDITKEVNKFKKRVLKRQEDEKEFSSKLVQSLKKIKAEQSEFFKKHELTNSDIPKNYLSQGFVFESGVLKLKSEHAEPIFDASIVSDDFDTTESEKAVKILQLIFENKLPVNHLIVVLDEEKKDLTVSSFALSVIHLNPNVKNLGLFIGTNGISPGFFDVLSENQNINSVFINEFQYAYGRKNEELLNLFGKFGPKRKLAEVHFSRASVDLSDIIREIRCKSFSLNTWLCHDFDYFKSMYHAYKENIYIHTLEISCTKVWDEGKCDSREFNSDFESDSDDEMIPLSALLKNVFTHGMKTYADFLKKAIDAEMYLEKIKALSHNRKMWWGKLRKYIKLILLARDYDESSLFFCDYLPLDMLRVIFDQCGFWK